MRYLVLVFIIIFMGGCGSQSKPTVPKWYLNPPYNNTYLYGTGVASSLNQAKTDALKNISENLVVTVQSSIETTTKLSNTNYSKNITKNIKLEAKRITFTNYKTEKILKSEDQFYILLKVNKQKLFDQQYKQFQLLDKKITTNIALIKDNSKLEQIYILQHNLTNIQKAKNQAFILYAIDNSFDYSVYFTKYESYIHKLTVLKNQLCISVISSIQNDTYKSYLVSLITKQKYKISDNNPDVVINLSHDIRYSTARGWQIAKVSSNIDVQANHKTISNNIINTIGRSSSTKTNALNDSAKHFNQQIIKLGLDKILFGR